MASGKPIKKNHFTIDPSFEDEPLNGDILVDKVGKVMKQKFSFLQQVYLSKAYESGYNSSLAFRVIVLYLHCQFKGNQQGIKDFDLIAEIQRFLNCELGKGGFQNVRKCMDLLIIKELPVRVADKFMSLWKIKVLQALKKCYATQHMKKEKKKASLALRQFCKQQLKKETIKHEPSIYTQILDILIGEQKTILNSKKSHGKIFQAIENASNIIGILEKSEQMIIPKYQEQLMLAYWQISQLHHQLHYVTYARKYGQAAINIAERINDKKIALAARTMLQSLAKQ